MYRRAVQRWSADAGVAQAARQLVTSRCQAWGLDSIGIDTRLIASELITNAVLHAGTEVALHLDVTADFLYVAVSDDHPLKPELLPSRTDLLADIDSIAALADRHDAPDADHRHASLYAGRSGSVAAGRGLLIVSGLADDWGTAALSPRSKVVWARLAVHDEWPFRDACMCRNASSRTPSGAPVRHIPGPWDSGSPSPS